MKFICKDHTPPDLTAYAQTSGASYQDLYDNHRGVWEITRLSLAHEQGYICCYCGRRISGLRGTQIEHIWPKGDSRFESMQLDYQNNLIASCDGGKYERKLNPSIPYSDTHCDTPKDNNPIPVHPLMPNCEKKFAYDDQGNVWGLGSDAEVTIKILNLTSTLLKNKRKAAIDNYSILPPSDWQKEYERLDTKDSNGYYPEFCFVLRSYIYFFHGESLTP